MISKALQVSLLSIFICVLYVPSVLGDKCSADTKASCIEITNFDTGTGVCNWNHPPCGILIPDTQGPVECILDTQDRIKVTAAVNSSSGSCAEMSISQYKRDLSNITAVVNKGCNDWLFEFNGAGNYGRNIQVTCPPGCTASAIWGTNVYTSDSRVCTAAAHAGVTTLASGGTFVATMIPSVSTHYSSVRNGITSSGYGAYSSSYMLG